MAAAHYSFHCPKPDSEEADCKTSTPRLEKDAPDTPLMEKSKTVVPGCWTHAKFSDHPAGAESSSSLPGMGDSTPVTRVNSITPPMSVSVSMTRRDMGGNRKLPLPPGKKYHYFLSHRKTHSKYGGVPEQVARNIHDNLEMIGFTGFFDIDNLDRVSKEDIREAVEQSCVMVVFLHDETVESEWCVYEWECAEEMKVPVKCVVDMQRFAKREVMETVEKVVKSRYLWVYQWGEFTERHRRQTMQELCDFMMAEAKIPEDLMNATLTGSAEIENLKSELQREKAESRMNKHGLEVAAAVQEQHLKDLQEELRKEKEVAAKMTKKLADARDEAESADRRLKDEQQQLIQQAKDAEAHYLETNKKEMDMLRELHKANALSRKSEYDAEALREDLRLQQEMAKDQAKRMEQASEDLRKERLVAQEATEQSKIEAEALSRSHEALVSELRAQLLTSQEEQACLNQGIKDMKSTADLLQSRQHDLYAEAKACEAGALQTSRAELGQMLEEQQAMVAAAAALKLSNEASHQTKLDEIEALKNALAQVATDRAANLQAHKDEEKRLQTIAEEVTEEVMLDELHAERAMNQKQASQIQADKRKLEFEKQAAKAAREEAERGLEAVSKVHEELYAMRAKLKRHEAEQASAMRELEATKKEMDNVGSALQQEQQKGMQQANKARELAMEASKKEFEALKMMNQAQADIQKAERGAEALRRALRRENGEELSVMDAIFQSICCCRASI